MIILPKSSRLEDWNLHMMMRFNQKSQGKRTERRPRQIKVKEVQE
jgi:hypothetical protein